jgi:hypothetical protein
VALLPTAGYLTRIELRRHLAALAVLGLLTALVVAVVLAALAGAERTETAFDRYLDAMRSPQAAAFGEPEAMAELARLDAVEDSIDFELVAAFPKVTTGEDFYPLVASEDGKLLFERYRLPVVDGRLPRPDAALEVALSERTAERLELGVGDALELVTFTPEGVEEGDLGAPDGPEIELRVVGVVRDPGDIGARDEDITMTFLTPAFRETYPDDEIGRVSDGAMIVSAPGHDVRDITEAMGPAVEIDPTFSAEAFREQLDPTMRSLATALRVFAAVAALAGVVTVALAAARLQQSAATDDRSLGALGAGRAARWARLALPVALATTLGAVVGGTASVAASPVFPIGLARRADPDLGFAVDAVVVVAGTAAAVVLLLLTTTVTALAQRRRASRATGSLRASPWGRTAAAAGAPVQAVTGLTLAGGPTSGTSSIAAGGALLGVLGVLAVLVFAASIERLRDEPELYGWPWDALVEGEDLSDLGDDPGVEELVVADRRVASAAAMYFQASVNLNGVPEYATTYRSVKGTLPGPAMVRGDVPVEADEVALGRDTLERLDLDIGDEVDLEMATGAARLRITGVVALPVSGDGGSLATGAFLSTAAIEPLGIERYCRGDDTPCTRKIALTLTDGTDPARFEADIEAADETVDVTPPTPPPDIDRLTAVEHLPRYLAAFLAVLAATAIGFSTASTVRQRRRDLAVLRVLGMTAGHLRTVVAMLVAALTVTGSLVGLFLGVAVGRQVWRLIADAVAVPFAPALPVAALVLVPLATLVLAQVVATGGRRAASRTPAAVVLRTE